MKPTLLCILDGFGIGDNSDKYNAIAQAHMPNYHRIIDSYPHSKLQTSGLAVGLPDGQIGNSEVGHTTIGSGRVIYQDLPKINKAINEGVFENNPILKNLISNLLSSGKACHLMGLFSDGGVHSHFQHIIFLANLLAKNGVKVFIHAFLDGRDVAQKSALQYFNFAKNHLDLNVKFATIAGRYYAMDRDKKWDRIELATNAIVFGKATNFANPIVAVEENYQHNITDEFVKPCTIGNYSGISEAELSQHYQILFPHQEIKNSLPEILAHHKLKQLRIAETEKYAHVTFFFSCGREQEFEGENRILVQSPMVATYDLKPEMSCAEVGSKLIEAINSNQFDFIVANFANPDMVGHSGLLEPSIKACEAIDKQLGDIEKAILAKNGSMIITADHGNIECMRDHKNQPHTAHTTNPVPFVFIAKQSKQYKLKDGALNDIAPSILYLLNIEKPNEMDGKNLIIKT
ncbi:MAG: 2,3-bisphosphoglycerate-independent phosphoglycerate mutase [Proteobacteria bacterium]|nr:2,3-bisphosphoglycerate-independent phosphoglycerate mutase [Pseudomonadota bacterium]